MAINGSKIKNYMSNGMNIIISGPAGTGKTSVLLEAASQLNWNLQYYSASTLDPYTDLVGLPVPNHETKSVEYFRPKSIDEADAVFFDEINRADPKTLNTLFELIQFRSINGEKLPKLKCVVAAMNPNNGEYTVDDLDLALLDRFDVYLVSEPSIDYGYFKGKFGDKIAREVTDFWREYHSNFQKSGNTQKSMVYISPRRMEKIVSAYLKIPERSTIVHSLPIGATVSVDNLLRRLRSASETASETTSSAGPKHVNPVDSIRSMSVTELRSTKNAELIKSTLMDPNLDPSDRSLILNQIATALSSNVGPARIVKNWGLAASLMTPTQRKVMAGTWTMYKQRDLTEAMQDAGYTMWSCYY